MANSILLASALALHFLFSMGNGHTGQFKLFHINWRHRFQHGGSLRKTRAGRRGRPLSTKDPLHVVFKINREALKHRSLRANQPFKLIHVLLERYSAHFHVRIEQKSIQGDHIHLLLRAPRRREFHHFFRVMAGQIAQQFEFQGWLHVTDTLRIWKARPFSRVVKGWRGYRIVRDYIQLNEKEARGEIRYNKNRLRGLSMADWDLLWS